MKQNEGQTEGHDEQLQIESMTRIVLRPIASPLPLAFLAFGVGSVLLSGSQLGIIPQSDGKNLALLLGSVIFPLELLAGVFCFFARETLAATVLGLISFSWLGTALVAYTSQPGSTSASLGMMDVVLATMLLLLGVIGISGKPLLSAVILIAVVRYGLNGVYELTTSTGVQTASGVVGCVILLTSLYGALALGIEDVQYRTVLPFGRRGAAREAIEEDLGSQVRTLGKEAGVRKQL